MTAGSSDEGDKERRPVSQKTSAGVASQDWPRPGRVAGYPGAGGIEVTIGPPLGLGAGGHDGIGRVRERDRENGKGRPDPGRPELPSGRERSQAVHRAHQQAGHQWNEEPACLGERPDQQDCQGSKCGEPGDPSAANAAASATNQWSALPSPALPTH